ncbi:MAG: hypothetical protein H6869_08885 [Rhodospirillales bacterium]|nr:hypothetical protein [Rhodospirillales bacterium]
MILLLLATQFALAQHASVHITDHGHIAVSHDTEHDQDGHSSSSEALCHICIIAHALTHTVPVDSVILTGIPLYRYSIPPATHHALSQYAQHAYQARAPPTLLS